MRRVSTDMPNDDMQYRMRRNEAALSSMQSKMASQTRIKELRDDPLAAAHAVRYESYLARLDRFEGNALYARDHFKTADGYLRQAQDVMQRVRELAVQGANGTYAAEDLRYMGVEVNELLKELVSTANAIGPDGKRLFAGDKAFTEPFRIIEGSAAGASETIVTAVEYQGSGGSRRTEVSEGAYSELDIGGGEAFWAEKMQIFSSVDATDWRAAESAAFFVDGVRVDLSAGDTLPAVVAKINDSAAPVKAYVDPVTRGIALEGTSAHLIRLEDARGSSALKELGILKTVSDPSAPAWNATARVSGGSAFDMVLRLRDALYRGDSETAGGQALAGIDLALDNLGSRLAEVGSRQERAEMTWKRVNEAIPDVTANLARESSLDFTKAATDLGMLEFAHKATLQTAAKIIQPTLLDFLR
ncbi:MAG TPA: flagellar hook-associated protein 3 [Treponema sp.]|nr:MAG: flagellar hook-associated protein 3 [Treponema sp. GWC1_61_84]OHE66758.1 MAG: flagellar hook-associated protein 3 [Treponema sp. GWA1_62_8]OHE71620.1 MAG: flagellar hook-associated protein 3 [Treponema sp. RIFOXYC1_FULL_61_9]HCM27928.1 flagellar hook-associated protein 3 [Treponema sp.]